jgi:hypothetical protein
MCADFCNSSADCTGAGSICMSATELISGPGMCSHSCNPITNSGCPSGTSCQILILSSTYENLTECTADVGSGAAHAACSTGADCRAGTFCADTNGDGLGEECIQWCQYPGGTCTGGDICYEFTDSLGDPAPLIFGGTEYGYCYT